MVVLTGQPWVLVKFVSSDGEVVGRIISVTVTVEWLMFIYKVVIIVALSLILFQLSSITAFMSNGGFTKVHTRYSSSCTYNTNGNKNLKQCLNRNYHIIFV